jgi:hypothetical protein
VLWEADIGVNGDFSDIYPIADGTGHLTLRGWPAFYNNIGYYIHREDTEAKYAHARDEGGKGGWREMGFRTPTAAFTVAYTGAGSFGSVTTDLKYTYRIYDENHDIESAHGPVMTLAGGGGNDEKAVLTFTDSVVPGALGTHLRVYRTLIDEEPGIYYRIDPDLAGYVAGKGIPLPSATDTIDDTTSNVNAQLNGTVRSDGEEGTQSWAEHGGPPPRAGGQMLFENQMVWWDVEGRKGDILYSAVGYVEQCPVDFQGNYQYYLPMVSPNADEVLFCGSAGTYLVVFTGASIWRISKLPTMEEPGFDRRIQEELTTEDGVCGKYAAASFGLSPDQAQLILYVSPDYGPSVCDGIRKQQIVPEIDWLDIVAPDRLSDVQVIDYPAKQEVWIFYTPREDVTKINTKALIVDYSQLQKMKRLRVTWPIDVKCEAATNAQDANLVTRLYMLGKTDDIYVQDEGNIDAQQNTNLAGDIVLDWFTPRIYPRGSPHYSDQIRRVFVGGTAGQERVWNVEHKTLDGVEEYTEYDTFVVGPGQTEDSYMADATGQAHRIHLRYQGPTGSNYDEEDAGCAPGIQALGLEWQKMGRQLDTKSSEI